MARSVQMPSLVLNMDRLNRDYTSDEETLLRKDRPITYWSGSFSLRWWLRYDALLLAYHLKSELSRFISFFRLNQKLRRERRLCAASPE